MSIESTISKAGPYIADGEQTSFPFKFSVLEATHVAVHMDGGRILTGFTVELADDGGAVGFYAPPKKGSRIAILRNVPITQETDIQNNTPFYPEVMEAALDKLTMIAQQLAEEISRCVKVHAESDIDVNEVVATILEFQRDSAAIIETVRAEALRCKEYAELAASTSVANAIGHTKLGDIEIKPPILD